MIWKYTTPGIPDELFEREERVPITKEEVRAVQISKARLNTGYVVYDVGCGSGSITVEAALQVGNAGRVIGIDHDTRAVKLSEKNLAKFEITNADIILGDAKDLVGQLDMADAIFIGGTGGDTADIIKLYNAKLNPAGRMIIGTILIETLYAVLGILDNLDFESVDITQITVSKSRKTSTGTMLLARNPVTIISATKSSV